MIRVNSFFVVVGPWFFSFCMLSVGHSGLPEQLKPLIDSHQGQVAIAVKHLGSGETFLHRETEVMPTASLIKLPVMVELYRQAELGVTKLDRLIELKKEDCVPGSGILTDHFLPGTQLPLETACRLMIRYSDNTATNLVVEQIGLSSTTKTMTDWGMPETQLHAKVFRRDTSVAPDRSQKYGLGSTTAQDMLTLLEGLHTRQLVSASASETMLAHLQACDDDTKILRLLPKTVKGFHKTGAVSDVRTDAGLFQTPNGMIAIVVLTAKNSDTRWTEDNAAEVLCGQIGKEVYDWFNPAGTRETAAPVSIQIGSVGELVESVQRALNKQLNPSPNLSTDGNFGPMTEAAVKRFQSEKGLETNGIVDSKTWEKLGPIQIGPVEATESKPLPPKTPEDQLEGPPFVTCKAWAIIDGNSGKLIDGHNQSSMLDFASTTKMMTAWLIHREAVKSPSLLDELVTFSTRADNTVGSTSDVRSGETLNVREALFGLMLPSGNDASVALAEHFGQRFCPENVKDTKDPLAMFVAAMNDEAQRLGMSNTRFANPHGLTDSIHKSTCLDLAILTKNVLSSDILREVVATREYRCLVKGAAGYQREVVWRNTNQLLNTEGYIGVKTGTTTAAGACLVSCSKKDEHSQIVIVLGSTDSASRYTDSKNLHRWGWSHKRP